MSMGFDDIPDYVYEDAVREMFGSYAMKEKSNEFNFVCPHCGDMAAQNKKKAYVYNNEDGWLFKCFKCGTTMPLWKYIKHNDTELYARLCFTSFGDQKREKKEREPVNRGPRLLPFKDGEIIPITDNHPLAIQGLDICHHRRIRPEVYESWYVCLDDPKFIDRDSVTGRFILDSNGHAVGNEYRGRIIIPYYRFGGKWNQFDARAIDKENPLRYRNFTGAKRIAYNIDFIRYDRPFYILEGSIDSTFIPNSIAIGGIQHLGEILADNPKIMENKENCVMMWDNDDAGRQALSDTVAKGFKWFDWDGIPFKDVNSVIMESTLFPLDSNGYVNRNYLESRTRKPGASSQLLMMMRYGDIKKRNFLERKERERQMAGSKFTQTRTFF